MDGTPITATYSIPAPDGFWNAAYNGDYQVLLIENEVEDVHNNAVPGSALGSFTVAIPESEQAIVASTTSLIAPGDRAGVDRGIACGRTRRRDAV